MTSPSPTTAPSMGASTAHASYSTSEELAEEGRGVGTLTPLESTPSLGGRRLDLRGARCPRRREAPQPPLLCGFGVAEGGGRRGRGRSSAAVVAGVGREERLWCAATRSAPCGHTAEGGGR